MVGVANANVTTPSAMPAMAPFSPTAQVRSLEEEPQRHAASTALRTTLGVPIQTSVSHKTQFCHNKQIR